MLSDLKRIMHVDDDFVIREITAAALEDNDFEILSCEGGKEAIENAKSFKPDLILIDYVMPDIGGPRTLSILKGVGSKIPVIFITGKQDGNLVEEYAHRGVIGVIQKPYKPDELNTRIEELWIARPRAS